MKVRAHTLSALASALPLTIALGCAGHDSESATADSTAEDTSVRAVAEGYVRLTLAVGEHDPDFVDAFYGPAAWRETVRDEARPLAALADDADALVARLEALPTPPEAGSAERLRHTYLGGQLRAVRARIGMLQGARLPFDEESRALYDAVAPRLDDDHYRTLVDALRSELEAEGFADGTVGERFAAYQKAFEIPTERLDDVFRAAIEACRERTIARVELPPEERFTIEYVTDQPWSAYNWYQGGYQSLIQVNTDLPVAIDRAVDLACHEGYPGHHVYNVLLEQHLVRGRGWPEVQIYPLFSPQSLIAEGSANHGIDMAFPGEERLAFERDVLFPLAGLDPSKAASYDRIRGLVSGLRYASNDAGRAYLDGERTAEETAAWLVAHGAMPPDRAAQRVRFIDRYRSYVINYNLGEDLVEAFVARQAGDDPDARWRVFLDLLSSPRLPSGLR